MSITRDEYFRLREIYANMNPNDITDAEMKEFIQYSEMLSRVPGASVLFGGDQFRQVNRMFYRIDEIEAVDRSKLVTVKSGINAIDGRLHGFIKGELTIVSGTNGSGKSTWLSQVAVEAAAQGFTSVIFSGELPAPRVKEWLMLQAAGPDHLVKDGWAFHVESGAAKQITEWMRKKIFIYNNDNGTEVDRVMKALEYFALVLGVDVIVLDNLMSMNLKSMGGDKYERQAELTLRLSEFAKKRNVHIFFVCHPRKAMGFLRKDDISGTADITNAADNVLIVHRVNNDFKSRTKEFFKWGDDAEMYRYSNAIEVCKNRDFGVQDAFAGTYFEECSKRFLNAAGEAKHYGWEPEKEEWNDGTPFDRC